MLMIMPTFAAVFGCVVADLFRVNEDFSDCAGGKPAERDREI
jgi:hypothetical protein